MITEEQLVVELQSDSLKEQAFRKLVSTYGQRLYWHIRKMVLDHDDADDVLQNTFIKVYKHIDSFKADSKLYTWLYRIATNEAINFLNKKSRRSMVAAEEVQQRALDKLEADVYFEGDAIQLALQKAIASLPERQRLVFNMKYFDDLTYEELSEILDVSVGGLKSSYHLAVKKIKAYLTQQQQ